MDYQFPCRGLAGGCDPDPSKQCSLDLNIVIPLIAQLRHGAICYRIGKNRLGHWQGHGKNKNKYDPFQHFETSSPYAVLRMPSPKGKLRKEYPRILSLPWYIDPNGAIRIDRGFIQPVLSRSKPKFSPLYGAYAPVSISTPSALATVKISLSPRPHMFMQIR